MSIIKASCIDQTLTLTNTPVIASGGVGEDFVEFSFCPLWDGYIKTGVFYNNRGVFYSILDAENTCVVPVQALQVPGNLFIAVFGTKNGTTRTSEVLQYQIVEGAITAVPDPAPDVYAQICQEIAELRKEWEGIVLDAEHPSDPNAHPGLFAPADHASQHASGGSDPLAAADIGAEPATESAEYPGCYYRIVNGITEWLNPPMLAGVEYRTTKRFWGAPVYTKLVSIGKLPNATEMTVEGILSGANDIVSYELTYSASGANFINNSFVTDLGQDGSGYAFVKIETPKNLSAWNGYLIVEYTKK